MFSDLSTKKLIVSVRWLKMHILLKMLHNHIFKMLNENYFEKKIDQKYEDELSKCHELQGTLSNIVYWDMLFLR